MPNTSHKFDPTNCNYTSWSPDTCGCIITYEWDKSTRDTPEIREHRPVHEDVLIIGQDGQPINHNKKCEHHKHLPDTKAHFDTILEENQRKNKAHAEIGIDKQITWEFDSKRKLHIYHEGKKVLEVAKS